MLILSHASSFPGSAREVVRREIDTLRKIADTRPIEIEDLANLLEIETELARDAFMEHAELLKNHRQIESELEACGSLLRRMGFGKAGFFIEKK